MSIDELNTNVKKLGQKIDKLEKEVIQDQIKINAHPVIFITLLIVFFMTMHFWAEAAHVTISTFHPRGKLHFWEYLIIALALLTILILLSKLSGINISSLEEN